MSTLLIAVDGTEHDQRLLEEAARLFGPDTDLFALNVRHPSGLSVAPITNVPPVAYGYTYPVVATSLPPDVETRSVYRTSGRPEAGGPTSVDEARQRAGRRPGRRASTPSRSATWASRPTRASLLPRSTTPTRS